MGQIDFKGTVELRKLSFPQMDKVYNWVREIYRLERESDFMQRRKVVASSIYAYLIFQWLSFSNPMMYIKVDILIKI